MQAIQVKAHGGPDALELVEVNEPTPGPGEIAVRVEAAGINFIDTYHRSGLYAVELPCTPGAEGAGIVAGVGDGVDSVTIGDRVAWAGGLGAYAEVIVLSAMAVVAVPDGVDAETAAATMLQGMTAHYLANDTWPLQPGERCLIHAAAGGTGRLLVQLAKARGAEVFATVGTDEKAELARSAGADHVINYRSTDFVEAIESIAGPRPLRVVYDGVGAATFDGGLRLLGARGLMATFGNASGPVPPISPLQLSEPSLYLTRPRLWDYISDRADLERRTGELFDAVLDGTLDVRIGHRYPLADAADAHRDLESRSTTGKLLLI